jgi:hypothetical protein
LIKDAEILNPKLSRGWEERGETLLPAFILDFIIGRCTAQQMICQIVTHVPFGKSRYCHSAIAVMYSN